MRTLKAVLVREWWLNTRAYRVSFFAATFMSSLFTLLIGYFLYKVVFAGQVTAQFAAHAGTGDYLAYLTLGVLVYTFTVRLLYPVRNFLSEYNEGTLATMVLQNVPRLTYQLGCMLFSALYSLVEVAVLAAAAALLFDLDFPRLQPGVLLVGTVIGFFGLYGLSLLLSALILHVRDRVVVEGFAFSLLNLVSGVAFPPDYLPAPLRWAGELVPLTHVLRLLRAVAIGGAGLAEVLPELAAVAALGAAYLLAGRRLLSRVVTRVLAEAA